MTTTYLHGQHESVLRSYRLRTVHNSAEYLLPRLQAGQAVLDVGCGPGSITADLAALVTPGRVVAADSAPEALAAVRATFSARGLPEPELVVTDAMDLQFADDTFDVVHAHQVLQHVEDPVRALGEMRRVCRPGGVVAARDADYAAMTWYPAEPELDEWLALYRRAARAAVGEPDAGRRLLGWARAAGFTQVAPSASTWLYATSESRAWWSEMWAERVTGPAFTEAVTTHGLATPDDLARLADAWRRWAAQSSGWFAILHGEIAAMA